MVRESVLTGKQTPGWRGRAATPTPEMQLMIEQLASVKRRLSEIETVSEVDRLKNKIVEINAAHAERTRAMDADLAAARAQISDLEARMQTAGNAAAKFEKERDALEARARSLVQQLEEMETAHGRELGEQESRLRTELTRKPEGKKLGRIAQMLAPAAPKPPSQVSAEAMRDGAGLLRRMVLHADGWQDIVIEVQRGGDNSITGVQIK